MIRRLRPWLASLGGFIAVTAFALTAAADDRLSQQAAAGPYVAIAPEVAADSAPPSTSSTVTLADDGQTLQMHVGDTFLLMLGTDYNWNVTVSDTSVLSRMPNITVIRGAQGIYQANSEGTALLTATGGRNCPPGVACPALARLFRLTVVVQ